MKTKYIEATSYSEEGVKLNSITTPYNPELSLELQVDRIRAHAQSHGFDQVEVQVLENQHPEYNRKNSNDDAQYTLQCVQQPWNLPLLVEAS